MYRRQFLHQAILGMVAAHPAARAAKRQAAKAAQKMPVMFIGHGSPMNAILDNDFTRHLAKLGRDLPRPRAILVVSAHWLVGQTLLSSSAMPQTLYDFGGFPQPLYKMRYPSPGDPVLAQKLAHELHEGKADIDEQRGLDHGAWTVLHHIYPQADIPVVQLSLNSQLYLREHLELANELQALRNEQVLILASGNIVHNLRLIDSTPGVSTYEWALAFDELIKHALLQHDLTQLLGEDRSKHSLWHMAHPTLEHYLPLLYAVGASTADDAIDFPFEGFHDASLSMRSVRFG
ncbi:4,5-DOPA dioxygenase extradiol [Chitinimonas sp. BJB300]|uniref:4,5-DOPA-extradiol-dioxygenase n=1 Tax=Chitinimonas sp. BJB300 TaxID=1559339 RepID=UPI000C121EEF|nr:4,5-DOPA dioxygenase extradiol [Chitinimonas sp. BJB300]PHV09537.1 4,5-DOPA dioxygenase extradiol [Chitinimonas sp. BJB300]TSJ87403.1 4,5-DOPA dioxygenase extradiol [Chitinimonas sp. BJB300]